VRPNLRLFIPCVVALLAAAAFLPAAWQGFVLGDDEFNLVHNDHWHGFGGGNLRWMWSNFLLGHYQPLAWMSFALDWTLWGGSPERIHQVNLALHAGVAVLVYWLFSRLLRAAAPGTSTAHPLATSMAAAFGALVFAVHPLRAESVAWATERRDLLSGLFLIACVLAWLRRIEGGGRGWLALALAAYTASLLSKAWGMTLPVVLLVLDVWPLRRLGGAQRPMRRLAELAVEKLPFVPLALGCAVLAATAQASDSAVVSWSEHGLAQRIAQASYGLVFYVAKTIAPVRLSNLYLLELPLDPLRPVYLASMAAVVAASALLWRARHRLPAALAAWASYAIIASPVLGFLQSGTQEVADRYSYLACLPLAALAGGAALAGTSRPRWRATTWVVALAAIAALTAASWRQTLVWRDSESLWRRAVEVEPASYIARHNLSTALHQEGRIDEAIDEALVSIRCRPGKGNEYARYHLGLLHLQRGEFERALEAWRGALELDPGHPPSLRAAVRELAARGRDAEAMELLARALEAQPANPWARGELARMALAGGDRGRAEALWSEGLRLDGTWVAGHVGLGRLRIAQGRLAEAEESLRAALQLGGPAVEPLVLLGRVLRATGRRQEAEACWERALAIDPQAGEARTLLGHSRRSP
jgi:tetratricopeptide (TPR) repeat protein